MDNREGPLSSVRPEPVQVDVLRVFTDENGEFGNPLGVVVERPDIGYAARQRLAAALGFSETVYIDDVATGRLQLFTPGRELAFAGHPLIGAHWYLARRLGRPLRELVPVGTTEPVPGFVEAGLTWVRGPLAEAPPWDHVELPSASAVSGLAQPAIADTWPKTQVWAWIDRPGADRADRADGGAPAKVRARTFARDFGVAEDEACGSASLLLAARLARPITVEHGRGSWVYARPVDARYAEVGGRVVFDRRIPAMPVG